MEHNKIHVTKGPTISSITKGPTIRNNVATVIGAITAKDLVEKGAIPIHDPDTNQGYQRAVQKTRIKGIAKGIKKGNIDLPTAILISIRDDSIRGGSDTVLSESSNGLFLNLSSIDKFYIVDGQHRYAAIKMLLDNGDNLDNCNIPFVCMIGASKYTEMHHFWVVNSTAKKVPTNLAYRLLANMADYDSSMMDDLVENNEDWKVKGQRLLDRLEASSSIWKGRIQRASDPKANTSIPSASMVVSFKKIFKSSPLFNSIDDHQKQAEILGAYWEGIRKVIPEVFSHPEKYSLQKGIGVRIMHGIFPDVLERARGKGPINSPDIYADIMTELLEEISGDNSSGEPVQGSKFWVAGKAGAAAAYSSGVGIRTLIEKSKRLLPDIEIEGIK